MRELSVSATYIVPLPANATDRGNRNSPGPKPGGQTRRGGQPAPAAPEPIAMKGSPVVVLISETMFQGEAATAIVPPSGDRATSYGLDHTWYVPTYRPVASSMACTRRLRMSAT